MSGRSTGEIQRDVALLVVGEWLREGIPEPMKKGRRSLADVFEVDTILSTIRTKPLTREDASKIVIVLRDRGLIETAVVKAGPGSELFLTFLERFWDFKDSPYVREKLAHEHRIGRRHCYDMRLWVKNYWKEYFKDPLCLAEVRKSHLQAFSLFLVETKKLSPKTANNCLSAGTVAPVTSHIKWTELLTAN
jgi:hypothetical protein